MADNRLEEILTLPFTGPVVQLPASDSGDDVVVLIKGERAVRRWKLNPLRDGLRDLGIDPGF